MVHSSRRFISRTLGRRNVAVLLFAVVLGSAALAWVVLFADLPSPQALITRSSPDTTKIYDRNGNLLYEILDPRAGRRTRVPLGELPPNFQHAVLAVEDSHFYQHPGVDPTGIARALWQDLRAGRIVAGGSTITQQLARELLLSQDERNAQTVTRKLREAALALRLTQAYSKDAILESYLNEIYFGNLAYGAEAAARTYFGKPARDLDLAEAALLAGLIQSPSTYNPYVDLAGARARQKIVLDLMVKNGYLTDSQAQLAYGETLHFKPLGSNSATPLYAPHFVTYVRNLLEEQYGAEAVNHGGLRVVTSLDLDLQQQAEAIVKYNISDLARRTREEGAPDHNLHDAALVALDPHTGEILAMVGSADYFDDAIDGAVNVALANRQPGSAIKPITYATAFARDYTPATVLSDVPTTFQTKENEPYAPQNYDLTWHGPISLRSALATSSNLIAVKVLDHVGLDAMIATAQALGITTFDDSDHLGLSLTLGGGEVKLLQLTAAYAAFANQGRRVAPTAILSVTDSSAASPLPSFAAGGSRPGVQAISPQVAYLITDILSDDGARISAFGEDSVLKLSRPAAAKTGTTTDFRDNWSLGYTPDLAVGVWAGNADGEPMYKISGITGAAPIWHAFMEAALKATPARDFPRPDRLVDVDVCESSGLLPTPYCPRVRREVFIAGSEPKQSDDSYRALLIDAGSGLLWSDGCQGQRVERVYRLFPADAQDWARAQGFPVPPQENCLGQLVSLQAKSQGTGVSSPSASCTSQAPPCAAPPLVITNPAQNATYESSPQLPPELQQIELSARLGSSVPMRQVELLLDGQPVAAFTAPPYRALWRLTPGEHQVQAVGVDAAGHQVESQVVRFVVATGQ